MSKIIDAAKSAAAETASFTKEAATATGKTMTRTTAAGTGALVVAAIVAPAPMAIGLAGIVAYSVGKGVTKTILARRHGSKHDQHAQVEPEAETPVAEQAA